VRMLFQKYAPRETETDLLLQMLSFYCLIFLDLIDDESDANFAHELIKQNKIIHFTANCYRIVFKGLNLFSLLRP